MADQLAFRSLRNDWYASNQSVSRALIKVATREGNIEFVGFPRQWIPIFEHYGATWIGSIDPLSYVPFFSDLSEHRLAVIVENAKADGTLRSMVEASSMLDPVIADLLYIVDNQIPALPSNECANSPNGLQRVLLNGWQSYGRPEVRALDLASAEVPMRCDKAVLLPCSRTRPYGRSKTHKAIYRLLEEHGHDLQALHKIVVSSVGVVPEELWEHPTVLSYDGGVPDIYRVLRLARRFFGAREYALVVDCLQFAPYRDVISILAMEGKVGRIERPPVPSKRQFYLRHNC